MTQIINYAGAVLRELGAMVRNWGDTEWSLAFVALLAVGYFFLKSNAGKGSL